MILRKHFLIYLFLLVKVQSSIIQDNCPMTFIETVLDCICSNSTIFDIIEYKIRCENSSLNKNLTLIQIKPFNKSQIDHQLIQSISIQNQHLILDHQIIDTKFTVLRLELINDYIETISELSLSNLVHLKEIRINDNPLQAINLSVFRQLDSLEILDLSSNSLNKIKFDLGKTINVREFYLDYNFLVELDGYFRDFQNLENLSLSNNLIEMISTKTFSNLSRLLKLNLESNKIFKIEADSFIQLVNLQEIYLDHNLLTNIHGNMFAGLTRLKKVKLDGNELASVKSNSFVSINITELDLRNQNIREIEFGAIQKCHNLMSISFLNNRLRRITPGFASELRFLQKIDFSNNFIEEIAPNTFESIGYSLVFINLQHNQIVSINSDSFSNLKVLNSLNLNKNYIQDISSEMFLGLSGNLEILRLEDIKLRVINSKVFETISNLKELYLYDNLVTVIQPFAFISLIHLKKLDLNKNQLRTITSNIFAGLASLEDLTLNGNNIEFIAENSFVNMSRLLFLDLSSNQLKSLNNGVFKGLQSLNAISLSNNRLESIENAFEDLNELTIIYLNSNYIREINNRTFFGIENHLKVLGLADNILDQNIDRNVFDKLGKNIDKLYLNQIKTDPSSFLNFSIFSQLTYLDLSQTQLTIKDDRFNNIPKSVSIIYLEKVSQISLIYLPMSKLINLLEFDISDNLIDWSEFCDHLSNRLFHFHPKLYDVSLRNTSLKNIDCLNLTSLTSLSRLDLSSNLIETIKIDSFKFKDKIFLQTLYLRNNFIRFIEKDSFKYLTNLIRFNIDNNLFENQDQIENINFGNFYSLSELSMVNSKLTKLPLFDSNSIIKNKFRLRILKLPFNQIESISALYFSLPNLSHLDLSNNRISRIDSTNVFSRTPNLVFLDLSSNLIDSKALSRINFETCVSLKKVNISYNNITVLERFLFNSLKHLEYVDVSHNMIIEIEANAFNRLKSLKDLYMNEIMWSSSGGLVLKENAISECESLKFVRISSIDVIKSNMPALFTSLKAISTNKIVNDAVYYNSINILVNNFDYYESDAKYACDLTLLLLSHRIHLNLFNDFDFDIFIKNCYLFDLN